MNYTQWLHDLRSAVKRWRTFPAVTAGGSIGRPARVEETQEAESKLGLKLPADLQQLYEKGCAYCTLRFSLDMLGGKYRLENPLRTRYNFLGGFSLSRPRKLAWLKERMDEMFTAAEEMGQPSRFSIEQFRKDGIPIAYKPSREFLVYLTPRQGNLSGIYLVSFDLLIDPSAIKFYLPNAKEPGFSVRYAGSLVEYLEFLAGSCYAASELNLSVFWHDGEQLTQSPELTKRIVSAIELTTQKELDDHNSIEGRAQRLREYLARKVREEEGMSARVDGSDR